MNKPLEVLCTPTADIVPVEGVPCRVWNGVLADGTKAVLFVRRVGVKAGPWCDVFQRELMDVLPPANLEADLVMRLQAAAEENETLRARVASLESGLAPFAAAAGRLDDRSVYDDMPFHLVAARASLLVSDFRAAAKILPLAEEPK